MGKRLVGRMTYANVMATAAVCLAIGGGVTLAAVSGSANVKFGGEKGLPESGAFETVLSVPGVGKFQARCEKGTVFRFRNTSGSPLRITFFSESTGQVEYGSIPNGDPSFEFFGGGAQNLTIRVHVFRPTAAGTPAADITAGHDYGSGPCGTRSVSAQAVSSD